MSKRKRSNSVRKKAGIQKPIALEPEAIARRDKIFDLIVLVVLLAMGTYLSVLYFAHQPVPNPDFTAFAKLGHELLSFEKPGSFKRAPVFGLLVAGLSYIVGGQHPDLTAGWMLNAILFPLCIVLLWQVSKAIIGRAGLWVTIIAMANPYVLTMLSEPIAEITLLFFVLLTYYFIFRGSRWSYLFASITMMVRYEGAALILAAFVMDMLGRKGKKEKIKSFICAGIASIPLLVWMMCTVLDSKAMGRTHYLKEMGEGGKFFVIFKDYLHLMWKVSFGTLFTLSPNASQGLHQFVEVSSKVVAGGCFLFGCLWGLIKRQWKILALLIFLVPYYLIHVMHSFVLSRFCIIVFWIVIIISVYGLYNLWLLPKIPRAIVISVQVLLLIVILIWLFSLVEFIPKIVRYSPKSRSVPYLLAAVTGILFTVRMILYKGRHALVSVLIAAVMGLMIVSNQFTVVRTVGQGLKHLEFKMLANWYVKNAQKGEKLVSAGPNILSIYAPEHKRAFVHLGSLKADNPVDFTNKCYERKITYVTWDSVGGRQVGGRYYKLWGFNKIAMLSKPEDVGPYEFITQIKMNDRQFINVFKLKQKE